MSKRIELYNFSHGQHRDIASGKFFPLQPSKLGRPLTHEEMDYNMDYMDQALSGYKIFGSSADTTLSANDVDKVLQLHRITQSDGQSSSDPFTFDYYQSKGFENGQYVWIPVSVANLPDSGDPCNISITAYTSGDSAFDRATSQIYVQVSNNIGGVSIFINGSVAQYSNILGADTFVFTGYPQGIYEIYAIDNHFPPQTPCISNTVSVEVTEGPDPCNGLEITSIQVKDSNADEDLACNLESYIIGEIQPASFGNNDGGFTLVALNNNSALSFTLFGKNIAPTSIEGSLYEFTGVQGGSGTIIVYENENPGCNVLIPIEIPTEGDPCNGLQIVNVSGRGAWGYECNLSATVTPRGAGGEIVEECTLRIDTVTPSSAGSYECDMNIQIVSPKFAGTYECDIAIESVNEVQTGGYVCNVSIDSYVARQSGGTA